MELEDEVVVVRTIVGAFETVAGLASWLRSLDYVEWANTSCWMNRHERVDKSHIEVGRGDGLGIQWYAEASLASGRGLCFGLQLSWDNCEWVFEAEISTVGAHGWDSLIDLAPRTAQGADAAELDTQARLLVDRRDEALRLCTAMGA